MKQYPSIPRRFEEFTAHVWDKLDGSNLRFEWSRKRGWHKAGTRTRLFDATDPVFGEALGVFDAVWAAPLADLFKRQRCDHAVAFLEFWGPGSFAGNHVAGSPKTLTLFDVAVQKQGLLDPAVFHAMFGKFEHTPRYLGIHRWTRGFVERVRAGEIAGVTFEGVVGKGGTGHAQVRAKAKTQAWIDAVVAQYGADATPILES
jgi:hypothetical protein